MTDVTELGKAVMAAQPFSMLIGAELHHLSTGKAEIRIPVRPDHLNHLGTVHGGVIAYLADNSLTYAAASAYGGAVITSEFKINFLKPVKAGVLVARAELLSRGRSQAVVRADILVIEGDEERLVAAAQGTIASTAPQPPSAG